MPVHDDTQKVTGRWNPADLTLVFACAGCEITHRMPGAAWRNGGTVRCGCNTTNDVSVRSDREYARLTADVVALAAPAGVPHVLLIRRAHSPFAGLWALPGGHVDPGEDPEAAARRELDEETGVDVADLIPVGVYSDAGRDPRGRYVTFAYRADLPDMPAPAAADDAADARWVPIAIALVDGLAFDHAQIVADARAADSPTHGVMRSARHHRAAK